MKEEGGFITGAKWPCFFNTVFTCPLNIKRCVMRQLVKCLSEQFLVKKVKKIKKSEP